LWKDESGIQDGEMKRLSGSQLRLFVWMLFIPAGLTLPLRVLRAQPIPLKVVVTPSAEIFKDGKPVTFAIHGFIEFRSLAEAFRYIEAQQERWKGKISSAESRMLEKSLLREAVESRVISMVDERPLEAMVTHTGEELRAAIAEVKEPMPAGYAEVFLAVQEKWKHSLNCWSASPVISARVLSNWYPIEEGIRLYGATYDSTEHFWQAVKYHPDLTVGDLKTLTKSLEARDWSVWLKRLDDDPKIYLSNAYAVEFLRANLKAEKLRWFEEQLNGHGLTDREHARQAQQRVGAAFRFRAIEDKELWGDLADTLHMIYLFSPEDDPMRKTLAERHFDGIYLEEKKFGFISEEYRRQMMEIWKVKYLQTPRFREVIAGIPAEIRLEHFLNDGDSPDIPIPIYVGYLNQIRAMVPAVPAGK
jgi:hypothetical protein